MHYYQTNVHTTSIACSTDISVSANGSDTVSTASQGSTELPQSQSGCLLCKLPVPLAAARASITNVATAALKTQPSLPWRNLSGSRGAMQVWRGEMVAQMAWRAHL